MLLAATALLPVLSMLHEKAITTSLKQNGVQNARRSLMN